MDLFTSMGISASGLSAQRVVVQTVSMNLANATTTRTDEGGPYRRRQPVLTVSGPAASFGQLLAVRIDPAAEGLLRRTHLSHFPALLVTPLGGGQEGELVRADVTEEPNLMKTIHDPSHPDADEAGYVTLPNINPMEEMVILLGAMRSYEANVTAFNAAKSMALKSLEIGR
jgi:flagellar basal-body rod protein FlgC